MKKNNQEVMEVEAEEMLPETSLDKQIENALVKENITDKVIRQLKETFGGMALKSIDDKESYLDIKKARTEVRRIGILVEKVCKKGREDAVAIQRKWLNKEKEVLSQISEVQDPLDAEIKKFEDEVARKENEEKQRREEAFMARQASLFKYGAEYRNGNYELAELSYESELIKNAEDEMWEGIILPKFRKVYEQKEAARVAEETKRREEMERQEKDRKELEDKQAAFRKEQEEFEKQKAEMQRQRAEQERAIREAEQKRYQEELQKKFELRNGRVKELKNLGCYYDAGDETYYFKSLVVVSGAEIESLSEKEWVDLVIKVKPLIEKLNADEEVIRLAQIEKEKQEAAELAAQKARERIAEEERLAAIKKAEEMEQASDKTRYEDVVKYLSDYPAYEMRSGVYKKRMNVIKDFIADLKEN